MRLTHNQGDQDGRIPIVYVEQPEADNVFSREEDRIQFLREVEAFLATHNPA